MPKKGKGLLSCNVTAIIPAAGIGSRFGDERGKSFALLKGRPLLLWTIEAIASIAEVTEIIPVLKTSEMECAIELFEQHKILKVKRIAPGGKERQDSVLHGLKLVEDKDCIILIHDGARPLFDPGLVSGALKELEANDGVIFGVPVKDTIKEVKAGTVLKTLSRESLWAVQTPQIFRYEKIFPAYERAMSESFYSTDDSALLERCGGSVAVVMGGYENIKITTPEDLICAEVYLSRKKSL